MKKILLVLAALAALLAPAAFAQKPCGKSDQVAAQKAIDRISTWPQLNSAWKSFRHCDEGTIGEQFTDAVLRLVVDWKSVNLLADAMKDADYHDFIIKHLKSPEAQSDAPDVYSRAKANCPKGLEDFCKDIALAVHEPPPPPPPPLELKTIPPLSAPTGSAATPPPDAPKPAPK